MTDGGGDRQNAAACHRVSQCVYELFMSTLHQSGFIAESLGLWRDPHPLGLRVKNVNITFFDSTNWKWGERSGVFVFSRVQNGFFCI
jgi:hypothetical protein